MISQGLFEVWQDSMLHNEYYTGIPPAGLVIQQGNPPNDFGWRIKCCLELLFFCLDMVEFVRFIHPDRMECS